MFKESVLNHHLLSRRYFYPIYEPFKDPYFVECGDVKLACWYNKNYPNSKTIIFFHGNGETVADYRDFFPDIFNRAGFNLFLFEFRGYGMSSGSPSLTEMLGDTECVIRQLNLPEHKLIFYGRSVGSIYAIHAASVFQKAFALISESGIADVKERILLRINNPSDIDTTPEKFNEDIETYFQTEKKLSGFKGRSLVMHTVNDQLVSVRHSKLLYDYLSEPKKLHLFDRGDHNTIFSANRETYFSILFNFLNE